MPADPQQEPSQTSPPCLGSCAEPSCRLLCTVGPGNKVAWDWGRGPGVPPALEQLQHGHPHPHGDREGGRNLGSQLGAKGAVKWSRKWRCASGLSCSGLSPAASPQPIARLQSCSTKPCCHPVALKGLGMAGVVDLHHPQHPSSLAGAKTSLPGPISLQLEEELSTSSSLTPFILNLVGSRPLVMLLPRQHCLQLSWTLLQGMNAPQGDPSSPCASHGTAGPKLPTRAKRSMPKTSVPDSLWSHALCCRDSHTSLPQTQPTRAFPRCISCPVSVTKQAWRIIISSALDVHQGCVKITVNSLLCPRT